MTKPTQTKTASASQNRVYFDQEWQDRDGLGWNVEFDDSEVVHRFATETEARQFANETATASQKTPGIWDEKSKKWIRPSGTVKQGRRPMFKPFDKAPCFPTRYDANGNLRTVPAEKHPHHPVASWEPAEKPTAQDLDQLAMAKEILALQAHAQALAEALRDVELRTTQARIASGIGKRKNQTEFLLGELERIAGAAREALERWEAK